jgi:hypothetical protein
MDELENKYFWTGGFNLKLRYDWVWCVEDAAPAVDFQYLAYGHIDDVPNAQRERYKSDEENYNCLAMGYAMKDDDTGTFDVASSLTLCNASNVFLHCESHPKYPRSLLVRTSVLMTQFEDSLLAQSIGECRAKCPVVDECRRNNSHVKVCTCFVEFQNDCC